MITIDDFGKVEIRVGTILSAEPVPETDKLLKLSVDFAEGSPRTVVSGIAKYFPDASLLVGKSCAFVTNLEPRTLKGIESQAMILAAHDEASFSLLEATVPAGTKVN